MRSGSAGRIVLAAVLAVLVLGVAVSVVSYAISGNFGGRGLGLVEWVGRYIPLQSVKIIIVAWQILTQKGKVVSAAVAGSHVQNL